MIESTPRVSIGLPVYNGERYLQTAIDSILAQEFTDFELVICDNASTDGTEAICRAAAADPRVRYHRQPENLGAAPNFNDCFRRASAPLFAWISYDDLRDPAYLTACVEHLDRHPESVLAYPRGIFIDEDGEVIKDDLSTIASSSSRALPRLLKVVTDGGAANGLYGVHRAETLAKTRLMDSFVASDRVLLAEIALLGQIHELPERLSRRRIHDLISTKANVDLESRGLWFDRSKRPSKLSRGPRLLIEYGRSVLRMPISWRDRLECLLVYPPVFIQREVRIVVGRWRRRNR